MVKLYYYPKDDISRILDKSTLEHDAIRKTVREIIGGVRERGNEALFEYTKRFDGLSLDESSIRVTPDEIKRAYGQVSEGQLAAIKRAAKNVLDYHLAHKPQDKLAEKNGKILGVLIRPVETAGIYVPGGTAPYPSSVIMCAMPARAAGVRRIIMCSPNVSSPLTLVAAAECGVDEIYKAGGAQAIAAMGTGTTCIPKTDIIAGPGNIYVTLAKRELFGDVKIDMTAGPSEILIIADSGARPRAVACDLLSQAEHDRMSRSILITNDEKLAHKVIAELSGLVDRLDRKDIARGALKDNGAVIIVDSLDAAVALSNRIAPEHLELCVGNIAELTKKVTNAGAIFAGDFSPEPLGDYYAGPSHVLPTGGTARHFEVLNTATFTKKISYIQYSEAALKAAAADVIELALAEGFGAHADSIKVRIGETK